MSQSGPSGFRKFFSKKVDEDKVEEEILSMVEEGHEQGLIEEGEMELINNIFEFGDKDDTTAEDCCCGEHPDRGAGIAACSRK